ncbi:hypothetical protein K2173_003193 [Erythroxylum novogranatense]|uniref:Uncharacterized protein n=1 Tax=Erythroxylum novogranatense TaxID=1862640 RepID=A0AAV8SY81_9ROSI|nr:hypothetical protein K2173_003193 [Erythroxylum novogranatense]
MYSQPKQGSKVIAGSLTSPSSEISAEEADNFVRSSKRVKQTDENHNVEECGDVEMENWDETTRKRSYKNSVTSFAPGLNMTREKTTEAVSQEDSNVEEVDDPECPTIHMSPTDKQRIRRVWANMLIVKVLGRHIGYRFPEEAMETVVRRGFG